MFVVPLVLGCIRFGCRRLYLYISRAFVAVCIYILLVACLCIYIYFAGVRRSLHLYIALRMFVHFFISLAFAAVCISILLFACLFFIVLLMVASVVLFSCVLWISYFRLFVVFLLLLAEVHPRGGTPAEGMGGGLCRHARCAQRRLPAVEVAAGVQHRLQLVVRHTSRMFSLGF
jgi:hypothetical protein